MSPEELTESLEALKSALDASPQFVVNALNSRLPGAKEGRDITAVLNQCITNAQAQTTPGNTDAKPTL